MSATDHPRPVPPYLDIHNATVFQGHHIVFDSLTLAFHRGENTVVLGPNGAGKTTLLKLLTRELYPVVRPDSYVKLDGDERVIIWELRQKVGVVSQDLQTGHAPHITGEDLVLSGFFGSIGLHGHHHVTPQQRDMAYQMMQQLDIGSLRQRYYAHLSTGQQRRFLLARALIHSPAILVFDEPTNGLDIKAAFELLDTLRALARQGTTLLLVTHHLQEIVPEIERVVLLKQGALAGDGKPADLITSAKLTALFDTPINVAKHHGFYQAFPG